jgi:hypothetical protein
MKRLWMGYLGLALGWAAHQVHAQEMQWRPVNAPAQAPASLGVRLLPPEPLPGTDASKSPSIQPVSLNQEDNSPQRIVRAQNFDPPAAQPLPPPPPPPPPGLPANAPSDEKYNCGVTANCNNGTSGGPGFFDQAKDTVTGIPQAFGNMFKSDSNRALFQSDHCFDNFCSPVSNPFYFEDPRALTEIKPLLLYEHVPGSNEAFGGGNIWFYGLQGRVAITDMFSVVIEKLGAVTISPGSTAHGISSSTGFAEVDLGPKFTFYRNDSTKTVIAAGLNFDLAIGSNSVFQNTGDLSLIPYFSIAQNFGKSSYGSFNFMNSTGYSFATDNQRTDFFYSSFHLDYDVGNLNKIFPLLELNWFHYTTNGGSPTTFGFEGRDLINFGSGGVAGLNDLAIAVGARYKFAEWLQVGFAAEFPLLHRDESVMSYRLGLDVIFRY